MSKANRFKILYGITMLIMVGLVAWLGKEERQRGIKQREVLRSLDVDMRAIIPNLDAHKPGPDHEDVTGKYLVVSSRYKGEFAAEMWQARAFIIQPQNEYRGAVTKLDNLHRVQPTTLVIVREQQYERKAYSGINNPISYRVTDIMEAWVVDRTTKQIIGYRQFLPEALPNSIAYTEKYRNGIRVESTDPTDQISNNQIAGIYFWVQRLYDKFCKTNPCKPE